MADNINKKIKDTKKPDNNAGAKSRDKKIVNKKSLAFSTISLVAIIAVIVISVIFNVIFANIVPINIDLTKNKEFSMSKEAKEFLKTIKDDVEIVGLFDEVKRDIGTVADYTKYYISLNINKVMEILDQFSSTNNHIKIKYVDPERDTLYLKKAIGDDAQDFEKGDFLVKSGSKFKRITARDLVHTQLRQDPSSGSLIDMPIAPNYDGAFIGAIINVTSKEDHVIGIVTDHSENALEKYYLNMKKELENRAYVLKEIKFAVDDLKDVDVLMFLGSKTDLTSVEASKLKKYLEDGGNAIFLMDSVPNGPEMTNFNEVLSTYNVILNNDSIEEGSGNAIMDPTILYEQLELSTGHPLETLNGRYLIMPVARSIGELKQTADYLTSYPIVYSSTSATSNNYTTGETDKGRVLLGTAIESNYTKNVSKILVMGSSGFVTDIFKDIDVTNTGLQALTKVLNWMEGTEDFTVPMKTTQITYLAVTESAGTLLGIITVFLVPLLIFAVGTLIWLRRRHL